MKSKNRELMKRLAQVPYDEINTDFSKVYWLGAYVRIQTIIERLITRPPFVYTGEKWKN